MKTETKLLSCPFCGGEGTILTACAVTNYQDNFVGACTNVDCSMFHGTKLQHRFIDEAIKAWNTRHQPTEVSELLTDMRMQAEYSHVVTMPIPLYERIKKALTTKE